MKNRLLFSLIALMTAMVMNGQVKQTNPDYIHENIETFDFALSNHEMERMHQLNKEKRYFNMSYEDQVKWFSQFNPTD